VDRLVRPGIQDPQNLGDVVPLGPEHGAGGHAGHVEHQKVQSPGLAGLVHQEDRRIGVLGYRTRSSAYAGMRRALGSASDTSAMVHTYYNSALRTSVGRHTGNPSAQPKAWPNRRVGTLEVTS
jgi:hypothetical protein